MTVIEGPLPEVLAEESVIDTMVRGCDRHRKVTSRDPLAEAHEVGSQAALLGCEQRSRSAESGRHFVTDEQYAGRVARVLQPAEILGRRSVHPCRALDKGLDDDGGQFTGVIVNEFGRRLEAIGIVEAWSAQDGKAQGIEQLRSEPAGPQ